MRENFLLLAGANNCLATLRILAALTQVQCSSGKRSECKEGRSHFEQAVVNCLGDNPANHQARAAFALFARVYCEGGEPTCVDAGRAWQKVLGQVEGEFPCPSRR